MLKLFKKTLRKAVHRRGQAPPNRSFCRISFRKCVAWGTGIDILIDMIKFACYLYLVCHEKPELMLRVRFTTSSCVESSGEKSFGTMPIATPL